MLEHQHVNMFTELSIYQILRNAGFSNIEVQNGSYGNTFHVIARKETNGSGFCEQEFYSNASCLGFFDRAKKVINVFLIKGEDLCK